MNGNLLTEEKENTFPKHQIEFTIVAHLLLICGNKLIYMFFMKYFPKALHDSPSDCI